MIIGAIALAIYSFLVCQPLMRVRSSALSATAVATVAWLVVAVCLCAAQVRLYCVEFLHSQGHQRSSGNACAMSAIASTTARKWTFRHFAFVPGRQI
jgi:uncharacterized membrane protein